MTKTKAPGKSFPRHFSKVSGVKLKYAPKVDGRRLAKLYNDFALGLTVAPQIDDVGLALYLRCQDIARAAKKQCVCPLCGGLVDLWNASSEAETVACPGKCGFEITRAEFRLSFRHTDLGCGNALPVFEKYLADYPLCRSEGEKMIAIDTLIHAFHIEANTRLINRAAGNNLISGSLAQVCELLDRLSGVQPECDAVFRESIASMWARRRAKRTPRPQP